MSKPRVCCVPCCKDEKFTLVHKFPSDNERAELWRRTLAIDALNGVPIDVIRKRHCICSRHFLDSDYKNKASRSINITAVPSINLFALNNAEGLNRKIPPLVRLPVVGYLSDKGAEPLEQGQQAMSVELEAPAVHDEQEERTLEMIKEDEFTIANDGQQSEKASCISYELNNFIEESFTRDPTMAMGTMEKNALLVVSPLVSAVGLHSTTAVSSTLVNKRTLLKRPFSAVPSIAVQQDERHPTPNLAKQAKYMPRQPAPPTPPTTIPTSQTVVLKRVKVSSFAPKERQQNATSCVMTQTDDLQPVPDKASNDGHRTEVGTDNVSAGTTSTKLLALLECTPENLQRLQQKLLDQGSSGLCLDERLLLDDGSCNEGDKAMSPTKVDDTKSLTIRNGHTQETASVSYVWLRDHCRCAECYNATTFQRSYSILDLPLDILPASCNIDDERINIVWKDGHRSSYDVNDIFVNQLDNLRKRLVERRSQLVLWDRALIAGSSRVLPGGGYASVTLNELLCGDDVMRQVVASLVTYGFAFITKVPPNQQSTEIAVKRVFPIQRTLFGEMWTFSDDKMDHSDTAYTNGYLGPHTDNTYFSDAAGLQVLHCIQFNGTGAETILLDGFRATERLREADPDAFERLCSYPLEAEYIEEDKHHRYVAPVIRRHPCLRSPTDGAIEQIRFNPYDRAPLRTLPVGSVPQFYADYQRFASEIYNEELQWKFQLTPGTVLIFDNWRILHGRMAYSGKRVMTGCYVARTEYQSVARTMGLVD